MPRRAEIPVRPVAPDPVYNSQLVTQVINKVMTRGKKASAEQIVYGALDRVGSKTGKPPVEVLEQAVKTVTPVREVRPRRVGGAQYQVPVEVPQRRVRLLRGHRRDARADPPLLRGALKCRRLGLVTLGRATFAGHDYFSFFAP